jgi:hypothetical protein
MSEANPRSSIAWASYTGSMLSSSTKVAMPNFIRPTLLPEGGRGPGSARRTWDSRGIDTVHTDARPVN